MGAGRHDVSPEGLALDPQVVVIGSAGPQLINPVPLPALQ